MINKQKIVMTNEIDTKATPIDRVAARVVYGEKVHFNAKRRQELKIEESGATWYRDEESALMHFELPVLSEAALQNEGKENVIALDKLKQIKSNSFVILGESPKRREYKKKPWKVTTKSSYMIRCKKCSAYASVTYRYIFSRSHISPSDTDQLCPYCKSTNNILDGMRPKVAPINSWTTPPLMIQRFELTSHQVKNLSNARAQSICKNLNIMGFMKATPQRKDRKRKLICGCKCGCGYIGVLPSTLRKKEIIPTDFKNCKYLDNNREET